MRSSGAADALLRMTALYNAQASGEFITIGSWLIADLDLPEPVDRAARVLKNVKTLLAKKDEASRVTAVT